MKNERERLMCDVWSVCVSACQLCISLREMRGGRAEKVSVK